MTKTMRIYTFTGPGEGSDLVKLAETYSLKQTQALILTIEETRDWTSLARKMVGDPPPECLKDRLDWLDEVDNAIENIEDAIDEDDDLRKCRQSADDEWYDVIENLCNDCPTDWSVEDDSDLQLAAERMSLFWIKKVYTHLSSIRSVMSGDGDVLAILNKYTQPRSARSAR